MIQLKPNIMPLCFLLFLLLLSSCATSEYRAIELEHSVPKPINFSAGKILDKEQHYTAFDFGLSYSETKESKYSKLPYKTKIDKDGIPNNLYLKNTTSNYDGSLGMQFTNSQTGVFFSGGFGILPYPYAKFEMGLRCSWIWSGLGIGLGMSKETLSQKGQYVYTNSDLYTGTYYSTGDTLSEENEEYLEFSTSIGIYLGGYLDPVYWHISVTTLLVNAPNLMGVESLPSLEDSYPEFTLVKAGIDSFITEKLLMGISIGVYESNLARLSTEYQLSFSYLFNMHSESN